MEFGADTKCVLGLPRAKQLGLEHCKKNLRNCDHHPKSPSRYTWDTALTASRAGENTVAASGRDPRPLLQEPLGHRVEFLQVTLVQGVHCEVVTQGGTVVVGQDKFKKLMGV